MSVEQYSVRPAEPSEVGAIALVLARANAQRDRLPVPDAVGAGDIEAMTGRMDRQGAWTHVVIDSNNEKIAGFAHGYPRVEETGTEHLSLLMIDPEYWGRRLASQLLGVVVCHAASLCRSRITLWTRDKDNTHARDVYEHKGFKLTGLKRDSEYGGQVEYQLSL